MKTASYTFSPSATPAFGYTYAFTKPTDWLTTALMSDDERFCSLLDYADEQGYWFADPETIYAKFVSKDTAYGLDLSKWTTAFTVFVEHYFASRIARAVTGSQEEADRVEKLTDKKLTLARSKDAMDEGPKSIPAGTWSRSRRGSSASLERGKTGRLLG